MLSIRPATINDVGLLRTLIRELAEYEQGLDQVVVTEADLLRDGFGERPRFRALIAEWNGQPAGYALFFDFYSTWEGRPGVYLEDIFVRGPLRGLGIGGALLAQVAKIARDTNCYGVCWEVLDWNAASIAFYKSIGATFLDEWRAVRLSGDALQRMAEKA